MKNASETLIEYFKVGGEYLKEYAYWVALNMLIIDLFREEPNYEDKYLPKVLGDLRMRI